MMILSDYPALGSWIVRSCLHALNIYLNPSSISPEHIFEPFYKPRTDCLLNYNGFTAIGAIQLLLVRSNRLHLPDAVPAGLLQLSYLPTSQDDNESINDNWSHTMEELSGMEDCRDSRKVLSRYHKKMSLAFNNSKEKESLEVQFKKIMNDIIVRARSSTAAIPSTSQGNHVAMLPSSSK
jgi:hypothetical protein